MRALLKASFSRPLFCLALGLCLGIAPLKTLASSSQALLGALSLALLISALFSLRAGRDSVLALLLCALGFCLGLLRSQGLARLLQSEPQPAVAAASVTALVEEDLGLRKESGRQALLLRSVHIEDLQTGRRWDLQGKLRLSYDPDPLGLQLGPGDRVHFNGSLHAPEPPSNPGEFDYRSFLLGRGVVALGSTRGSAAPDLLEKGSPWNLWRLAWRMERCLGSRLEQALSPRAADLTRGMLLGDTGGLSQLDMSVYARTGIVHILSVSGLHLALALAIFLWIGKRLGLGRRGLAWLALPLAFAYAMICGLPVPCERSLCLFALVLLGQALDLDTDIVTSLAAGAILVLLQQPGALFEAGAQLSFVVSLSLVTLTPRLENVFPENGPAWLRTGLAGTLAAEAAAVPLVAWHFGLYCWPALVATIATAPLMGPVVGLGMATAVSGWQAFAWPLEWVLKTLDLITGKLAWLPYAAFSVGRPPLLWMLAWLAGVLVFAASPRRRWALLALPILSWLLWPGLPWVHRHPGLTKTWFLSVGQGDSSLTEFEDGSTLLVDAGPLKPDAGSWVVGPALRNLGINRVDWAVVTHPHADHLGGMFWILRQFPVKALLHSGTLEQPPMWLAQIGLARELGVAVTDLNTEGPPLAWQGRIEKLAPKAPRLSGTRQDMHNNNVVLRVGAWLMLMGDMQKEGEQRLLRENALGPCDVLKAGHHGSRTSSTPAFLRALDPKACVISCGQRNRYRHPSPLTLEHLKGRELYRTDLQGCIFAEHDAQGTRLRPWRVAPEAALWQAPPKQHRSLWKTLEKEGE